jgi:outer membrane protein insertion porin family/translocation and assembly module TamA
VRGFRQNELGPAVYIPTVYDTVWVTPQPPDDEIGIGDTVYFRADPAVGGERAVPTGGNTLVVANVELRFVSPFLSEILRWTAFADVGEVWNRGADAQLLRFSRLKVTPGIGVRLRTPIGYLRADVAYNPYQRGTGAAYFDTPVSAGGLLYCVSPGNTLPVTKDAPTSQPVQLEGPCPGTFLPPSARGFFRRLTPSIAIGHAF